MSSKRPLYLAPAVVAGLIIVLAGCSSSGSGSAASSRRSSGLLSGSSSSSSSLSGSNSSGGDASNEASKSADQIFNDSLAAMRQVDHVHITGTQTDGTGTYAISGDVTMTAARIDIRQGGSDLVIVTTGGKAYASQDGSTFVELSPQEELRAQAATLSKTLDCANTERGILTKGSITTINGIRVIAINDDGKAPGDAPNVTYVALDGSLHVVESKTFGRETPGGSAACGHSPTDSVSAAQTEYDYQAPAPVITPPPVSPGGSSPPPSGPIV
jgi:hypothetical protein